MKEIMNELNAIFTKYPHFLERKVYPYSFPVKASEMMERAKDYDLCEPISKAILRDEMRGLLRIAKKWKDTEENGVQITFNDGRTMIYDKEIAALAVKQGIAHY